MADAIVGVLVENLNSIIQRKFGLLRGVADDMKKLHSTLTTIQAVLEDAESKKNDNKPLETWLAKLIDASFEATDFLFLIGTRAEATEMSEKTLEEGIVHSPRDVCSCIPRWMNVPLVRVVVSSPLGILTLPFRSTVHFLPLPQMPSLQMQLHLRRTIAKETKMLITRFDEIAEKRLKFHLDVNVVRTGLQLEESRESRPILEADVVGRDDDKESVIQILCNNMGSGEDLSVLPIIGMGGLGKTTLAQWVYNDHRVKSHFEERIWVCVSDNFEVKGTMKMMLESLNKEPCNLRHLDTIEPQLEEKLRAKKFLLVLDDVWNEDAAKWMKLKSVLKRWGAQGSSILVTTRQNRVASIMGSVPSCSLKRLTEEESWVLFKDCAFGEGKEEVADLVNIGKEIVEKCVGVPLAVKSLGRLVGSKTTVEEWKQVRDSKIWELKEEKSGILPALKLSYNHLPWRSKRCFTFCSVYPKDYRMNRDDLIQLWMANGYLESDGRMEPESWGKQIFDELLDRNFFQECRIENKFFREIKTCKMHHLIHDLACSMTVNECSVVEVGRQDAIVKYTRHLSLIFDLKTEAESSRRFMPLISDLKTGAESSNRCPCLVKSNSSILRTLILLGKFKRYIEPAALDLENLYSLRALDMRDINSKKLPNSIGKMKHLGYLNLSGSEVEFLPEFICNLRNLKCLILRGCGYLQSLPKGMRKMRGLRHLDIEGCVNLSEMPDGMEQLTQLQTLSGKFRVGPDSGARVINGLKGMKQLRGGLIIEGLKYVRSAEANLIIDTQHLSLLKLDYWIWDHAAAAAGELQEKVLGKCLQPHPNLKELFIYGYGGGILPSWMGELQNLVKIRLAGCDRCEHLPALGRLPLLKILEIRYMYSIKCIDDEFYGVVGGGSAPATTCWFPSLQELEIEQMPALEKWSSPASSLSEEGEVFPCLKQLTIEGCPRLTAIPCLPCVQNISLGNCHQMILRSISNLPPRSLLTLEIQRFEEMTHLPEGTFINSSSSTTAALQSLRILDCNKLKSVSGEIQNLTSLTSLEISGNSDLDSLSELKGLLGKLTSLAKLTIAFCCSLKCLPVMGIQGGFNNSLTELTITDCSTLTSVSEGLQYLNSLQELYIYDCGELELMTRDDQEEEDGFQHLISLQRLTLELLPKLRALPEGMQHLTMLRYLQIFGCENLTSLPDWLQHLTSLQSLEIKDCHPDLYKRCKRDKGEDWHIISHIPHLYIDIGESRLRFDE